jgi:hypothetical protein
LKGFFSSFLLRSLCDGVSYFELSGVGIGWRPEFAVDLLHVRDAVSFVEVLAELCFSQARARREALALAEIWPVVPHGVKLSLGSAEGIDDDRARRLGALARTLRSPLVSEHVALTSAGGWEVGHLTQLPRTREAVTVVARNVYRARRYLPDVPLLLENVAWTVRWPDDVMPEEDFYQEVVRATGCPLLLDLGNLHANARNEGRDPFAVLRGYPLDQVAMVHIAGGHQEDGFYFDDHASPVPDAVFQLLEALTDARGAVPVLLERDANFPPFTELCDELDRARAIAARAPPASTQPRESPPPSPVATAEAIDTLEARQAAFARALADRHAPLAGPLAAFSTEDIARTREVLQRKRVENALPLLPRLSSRPEVLGPLARAAVDAYPRPARGAALSDAMRIATRALAEPSLAVDARIDLLVLRARFRFHADSPPGKRLGPFIGQTKTQTGRRIWALKGPGVEATVRLIETRSRTA